MAEIATRGPVAAGIDATVLETYTGGIITQTQPANINHIISIVGYGTDAATGLDYWIGRNSWGQYCKKINPHIDVETILFSFIHICFLISLGGENGWFRIVRGQDA